MPAPSPRDDADPGQLAELFAKALERPPGERRALLDSACSGSAALRAEVDALLAAHEQAGTFLERLDTERGAALLQSTFRPEPSLLPGTRIGHYEILHKLGQGGMGEVYLASDASLDRKVALKFPALGLFGSEEARLRFLREARLAAALEHPSICRIFELGEFERRDFIAMEYVEGETLAERLASGPLPLEEALRRTLEIISALEEAHDKGIVHRDLKPGNLMISARGQLKVMDFSLAKRLAGLGGRRLSGVDSAATGRIIGTPAYMAPEQLRNAKVDVRTDIFALGVVLYETLTGTQPFRRRSAMDTAAAVLREVPPPVSAVLRDVPQALERVVERMLAKDAAERYPTVRELRKDLERVIEDVHGMDSSARRPGPARTAPAADPADLTHGWPAGRRLRPAVLAVSLGAVLALAGLLSREHRAPAARPPAGRLMLAVLPFENLSGDPEQDYLTDGLTEEMITELGRLQPGGLGVIARTSVMQYRENRTDMRAIGRELGVDLALEGSVRRENQRLRISAQLIRTSDQALLWADTYDSPLADVLKVQAEVARATAREIQLQLPGPQPAVLGTARAVPQEAHESYLKGRHFLERRTAHDILKARALFERAVAVDPGYALAYVGLADSHLLAATYSDAPSEGAMARAREAVQTALDLDEHLPQAHAWMGTILTEYDWDWKSAERSFRRALELNPNLAAAHKLYAEHLSYVGRHEEAVAEAGLARRLDPLSIVANGLLGTVLYRARRYPQAIEQLRQTIELDPNHPLAYLPLGLACSLAGRHEEALAALERGRVLSGDHAELVAQLAYASARAGRRERAEGLRRDLMRRAQKQYVSPFVLAVANTGLGRDDEALDWLEKGYAERLWLMCVLKTEPIFDSLRDHARFRDLLGRMNLLP